MSTVKRAHRRLEARLYSAEKMLASAAIQQLMPYPRAELASALEALLFSEFHDILPGSSVAEVEAQALHRLGHGFTSSTPARARVLRPACRTARAAGANTLSVHNLTPSPSRRRSCASSSRRANPDAGRLLTPELALPDGTAVPLQLEKESSNIQADQRKRIAFHAVLPPSCMSRYLCRLRSAPKPPARGPRPVSGILRHLANGCEFDVDARRVCSSPSGSTAPYRAAGVPRW
jgi:alpha-mannosidase